VLDIDRFSKETVHDILLKHLVVINAGWFKFENLVRATHPEVLKSEGYMKILEEFCMGQARELAKVLGVRGNDLDSLIELLKCSQWAVFERFELEKLTETDCRMRIRECSTQRAARKWGMEHYACAEATLACLRGFCGHVNRGTIVRKQFAPPDDPPGGAPEGVSCEWVISIAEDRPEGR